ncbi:MAG TPA: PIG-L family deacetylase [Vicinamibacterales bacterium]|nr:PIG-L family deacetylase [Vicinamibacterales bacterium]
MHRTIRAALIVAAALIVVSSPQAQLRVAPLGERPDGVTLELLLRKLASTGTFMQTDAHPDDEDNGLLAMLGHGRGMRTALVTLTRGDGGQNEIGPEIGQALGVLRTEELLGVHRFDGAEQYFTRAIDFGFSFSVEESIEKWGHDEILGDLVRHIRTIRPDVIAGFLCGGQAGGLHHQASAKLTREAFRAAADPAKYPEQIKDGLRPWQAVRYFCTDETSFAPQPPPRTADMMTPEIAGFDASLGRTYAEIGLEARSMHKCQGTSQLLLLPGQSQSRTYRLQDSLIDRDATAPPDLFTGIDVSLNGLARFAGATPPESLRTLLAGLTRDVSAAIQGMTTQGSFGAVAPLVAGLRNVRDVRRRLPALGLGDGARYEIDLRLAQKERQFQDALLVAAAVRVDALADDGVVTAGQPVGVSLYATSNAGESAQLREARLAGFDGGSSPACTGSLAKPVTCKADMKVAAGTHLSTPYWTPRKDAARYDFEPDVPFGVPFRPSPFRARFELTIGGEPVTVERPVQYRYSHLVAGEKRTELNVSPAFNVTVDPAVAIFSHERGRKILTVTVANNQKGPATANVSLQVPAGWRVEPATAPAAFAREDEAITVKFTLTPPATVTAGDFAAKAVVTGNRVTSDLGYEVVEYPHIRRRHVVQPAAARIKVLDVTIAPGLQVGYVMGVGDKVPDAIEQLGAAVTLIDAETLASGDLSRFDTILLGVRAYERRQDLRASNQRLLQYADNGGTVIVQYQRTEFNEAQYGPFPAKTTADRVTDENAPIEILAPDHPLFTTPNRIGPETWQGWVQERGTYFMGQRDPRYVDLLRAQDPFPYNAGAKTGIMVEARVGKGRWIYTGLGLWRQLPAGTDGAYRLLANLLSLGKRPR